MGSSKKSRSSKKRAPAEEDFSDAFRNFKALFPLIQSPQGIKPPLLKNLYSFLGNLSSNAQWSFKYSVGSRVVGLEICHDGIEANFEDICELSDLLFSELEKRFEQLFANLCGEGSSDMELFDAVELINLLFRCCCMLLLTLLEAKPNIILEKGPILLKILRKLSCPKLVENTGKRAFIFEESVFRKNASGDSGCSTSSIEGFAASLQFLEPYNPLLYFMSTMFEVLVDELLTHRHLGGYFELINSIASVNETLFGPRSIQGDTILIEAICNHFILSFSDNQAFGDFLSRLFYMELKDPYRAPALGVTSATSLLLSPIMVSAPKYMQAHLISLVSEAVYIKGLKPDRKLANFFLSTFEKSVILYTTHMSGLQIDDCSILASSFISKSTHDILYSPFEFYISSETKNKVDSLIAKLENSSNLNLDRCFFSMKSDLVSSCMRFVKECQNVYATSCQDEIFAILSCLVLKASENYDAKEIQPAEGKSLQHIYLLASLLKLMSISLLQVIQCLRHSDDSCCCMKTLKDFPSCKEYGFILEKIAPFREMDNTLPLQELLSNVMSSHSTRHVDSKMMFLHFSGLMSLSFVSGLDCLVKACLLTILAVLNLFIFEEGDLSALLSIVDSDKESFSSGSPVVKFQEIVVYQNSSLVVASKFHSIRSLFLSVTENKYNEQGTSNSQTLASSSHMEAVAGLEEEEETEETSNGEIFLNCLKIGGHDSNFDDLVDFVECKHGKDYSAWLKNRQRYWRWKSEKMAVLRWKRKKKTWKTLKEKRN